MIASHRLRTLRAHAAGKHMRFVLSVSAPLLVAGGIFACSDDPEASDPNLAPDPSQAEPLFRDLEADLVATCGGPNGTCHVQGSFQQAPTWLADPDPYVSIRKYPGMLPATKDIGDSLILTQVKHAGPSLKTAPNNLFERVSTWLSAEVPGPALPTTGAFPVQSGFNQIDLGPVASGLAGGNITFVATDANGVLTLDGIKVRAPNNSNLKLEAPFFVILPRNGKVIAAPAINGFQGELTVPAGATVDMYSGKMVLLRWDPTGQLKLVFNKVEATPGTALLTECSALDLFKSSALPQMRVQVDELAGDDCQPDADGGGCPDPKSVIGKNTCIGCHGGGNATAQNAMDLGGTDEDPARACAQARNWINFDDKSKSTILLNPLGTGNPQHPMGAIQPSDPIIVGIKAWVDAERKQ